MKLGQEVYVCYDGKWSRRVLGVITEKRKGHHIKVKFKTWADEELIETWFPKRRRSIKFGGNRYSFEKYVLVKESLMDMLFGTGGDWYRVVPKKVIDTYYGAHNIRKLKIQHERLKELK